jgi:threonyl-tRNA synthetase
MGEDAAWEVAEQALHRALKRLGLTYGIDEGGGAFYGPKIDIKLRDAIGREWQGTTIQLDYQLPERFELEYTGSDNKPHRPVMIHRAILGTLERFVGCLIEHFAGAFPVWETAHTIEAALRDAGIRSSVDDRNDTLNYRVRDGEMMKVPYLVVVGKREVEQGTVAVRARGAQKKQEVMSAEEFRERVVEKIRTRALEV